MNPSNQSVYREWALQNSNRVPLFMQAWWLDAVCDPEKWNIALAKNKDEQIAGALPYFEFSKKNIPILGMPPLTPYLGIWFEYPANQKLNTKNEFEKNIIKELIGQFPSKPYHQQKFLPPFQNGLPFYWNNFQLSWRYTYYLSLNYSKEYLWDNLDASARTQLRKSNKLIDIEITEDTSIVYDLVEKTFQRQSLRCPYSLERFKKIYNAVRNHEAGELYIARLKLTGQPVACMFLVIDQKKLYNLVLGRDHILDPGGSINAILWSVIEKSCGTERIFDFEGSMLEGPENLFRSFGSERIPVLEITRYKNRVWKALFALVGK